MNSESKETQQHTPFHEHELLMQERVGRRERLAVYARKAILPYMTEQHREFFAALPFIVVGSVDEQGNPWASMLSGKSGFAHSPEAAELRIDVLPNESDPLFAAIKPGAPLGLLGIELSTRRRNRLNANVSKADDQGFSLKVAQAYGNCPKYIQTRDIEFIREADSYTMPLEAHKFTELNDEQREMIRQADTFFVSSYSLGTDNPEADGVDVSHRGGLPGFITVDGNSLTVPDYAGNNIFNTIGNFLHSPKAGLVFPDFSSGDLMMLTGSVEVLHYDEADVKDNATAERAWRFTVSQGVTLKNGLPFRADLSEYSPYSVQAAKA